MIPPRRPQLPGDPDPLHVELQPVDERVPWHEPRRRDEPAPAWLAWLGLGICVGILLGALVMVAGLWLRAAPSPAPHPTVVVPRDLSELRVDASDPAQGGAPLRNSASRGGDRDPFVATTRIGPVQAPSGASVATGPLADELAGEKVTGPGTAEVSGGAPQPPGTALGGGWATWCAPTSTQCQGWGGDALLGATPSFVDGDRPYDVRVCADGGRCVVVRVVSFCGCADRRGRPTVIDLSPAAFEQLAPLRHGIVLVTLEWPLPEEGK